MTSGTIEKSLAYEFLPFLRFSGRVVPAMLFADGENLAIRYKELSQKRGIEVQQTSSVAYEPDVLLWSDILNELCDYAGVVRKHYYTSVVGSEETRRDVEDRLKNSGIESPYVFKKPKHGKNRRSKAVDISLAVDMLTNAHRKNHIPSDLVVDQ